MKIKKYLDQIELSKISKQLKGAYENYKRSNSNLWANTLSYFTLLSLIPMIAIIFSIGSWFGLDQYYLKQLELSSPLNGETIEMLINTANSLLENTRSGLIAGVGFISLAWVMISMFTTIEKALNSIWGIRKTRPFFRKLTDYLTIFFILPMSIIISKILISFKIEFSIVEKIISIIAPYIGLWIFFVIFYKILLNTKISIIPVIWSSFITSFFLNQSNMLILKLQTIIVKYNKIYGSFSVLLLSLIWLKVMWFLILLGAHFGYILQNRLSLIKASDKTNLNFNSKLEINKNLLMIFVENYKEEIKPLSIIKLEEKSELPIDLLRNSLDDLEKMGYISEVKNEELGEGYRLTKNIENITTLDLIVNMKELGERFETKILDIKENEKYIEYLKEKNYEDKSSNRK